ncbi:MAG: translation initiation factor IF-3 [Candidatus Peregrinibacteria bacterium]
MKTKKLRKNHEIRVPKVLLIEGDGSPTEMDTAVALQRAQEKGMDLVEVSPFSQPPVCKLMDYGSYLYEQKKKAQKQKKASKQTETKTIRLSIRTGIHDLEVKARQARIFLENRHTIKVVVIFKGREMTHGELGEEKMREFQRLLQDVSAIEQEPKRQGYQMVMMLNPLR